MPDVASAVIGPTSENTASTDATMRQVLAGVAAHGDGHRHVSGLGDERDDEVGDAIDAGRDGRATLVALTQLGRRRFADASAVHRRGVGECFDSRITIAEARALTSTLARVLAAQGAAVGAAGPVRPLRRPASG